MVLYHKFEPPKTRSVPDVRQWESKAYIWFNIFRLHFCLLPAGQGLYGLSLESLALDNTQISWR